ncbi:MAG: GAF domain-containing protein [Candidatus Adiutrix sp.]|jgi:GGDEF domain-containing protein|nr:GAF domain-containing protein [Candidatus Adiutrix sp.]
MRVEVTVPSSLSTAYQKPALRAASVPRVPHLGVDLEVQNLVDLCLNNLDAFSVVLFSADRAGQPLRMRAFRSLSGHIDPETLIYPGQGLLGWAYKNARPVNVDQVSFESDRLLFYTRDENIKSFMAVPLPSIYGVLAVDSKQRYFFTDKSAKLLMQFGDSITRVWRRVFKPPVVKRTSGEGRTTVTDMSRDLSRNPAKPGLHNGAAPLPQGGGAPENDVLALWQGLEFCLSRSDHEGGGLTAALELIRQYAGLSWAFLTVVKTGDRKNYHLVAAVGNTPESLSRRYPLASGLAGWLHTKLKPLAIDRLKADSRNSFIFHKTEPLRGFRSFYGWPVMYNGQPRGSLILAGGDRESLDPDKMEMLECVADRLAAQFHLDRLIRKVMEMDDLDPQTGLSHRSHFIDSLHHLMEVADLKGEGVDLFVLATSGLGAFAAENGQEAAADLLRSIARRLKEGLLPNWRLGHVSYGVFTLAAPTADAAEAKTLIAKFKKSLENWPLTGSAGRAGLGLYPALASYPRDGSTPERLLETALIALAEADEE